MESEYEADAEETEAAAVAAFGGTYGPLSVDFTISGRPIGRCIELTWDAFSGADSYKITRSIASGGTYEEVGTSSSPYFFDVFLTEARYYYYVIEAYKGAQKLEESDVYSVRAEMLNNPMDLEVTTDSSSSLQLTWDDSDGPNTYYIYRSESPDGPFELIDTTDDQEYLDEGLKSDTPYYYGVVPYYDADHPNVTGASGPIEGKTDPRIPEPPNMPENLQIDILPHDKPSYIELTWEKPSTGPDPDGYEVFLVDKATGNKVKVADTPDLFYDSPAIETDVEYTYYVRAYNDDGASDYAGPATGILHKELSAPQDVTAIAQNPTTVKVDWSEVEGADGYYIYRSNSPTGTFTSVGQSTTLTFTDNTCTPDTEYYYVVQAYDSKGKSPESKPAYVKTPSGKPETAPQNVKAEGLDTSRIEVTWSSVSGATSYRVYRSDTATGTYTYVGQSNSTSFINTGLKDGTGYYYKVSAVNSYGEGPQSVYAYGETKKAKLPAPGYIIADAHSSSLISVIWQTVPGADGYYVYRSNTQTGSYTYLGESKGGNNYYYWDTGLTPDTGYYYVVAAYNKDGIGDQSTWAYAKTHPEELKAPVTINAYTLDESRILVNWSSVSGADGYYVYRSYTQNGTYTYVGESATTTFLNTGLTPDTGYYYKVAAYNKTGTGPQSTWAYAKTKAGIPATPVNVRANGISESQIQVAWNAVSGATGYRVYRSSSENGSYSYMADVTGTTWINQGLPADTGFYYKVEAYNTAGASARSDAAYGKTHAKALTAPINVQANGISESQIQVTWNSVSGATGYRVYRSSTQYGSYSYMADVTSTTWINQGLPADTGFYYQVEAYNSAGTGPRSAAAYGRTCAKALTAPINVQANGISESQIQVTWGAVSGATGYRVYRSSAQYGSYSYMADVTSTAWINQGLPADTGYFYQVEAYNAAGTGPRSAAAYGRTHPKTVQRPTVAPTITATGVSTSAILTTWNSIANVDGYYLYRSATQNGVYTHIATVSATARYDTGLPANTGYYYKVEAYNAGGVGPRSAAAYGKTFTGASAPTVAPTVKATGISTSQIQVTWNTISGATGYYVYRSASQNGTYSRVATVATAYWTNSGLPANTGYYYKVEAYNSVGIGPRSAAAYGKTLTAATALTDGNYVLYRDGNFDAVEVWWKHDTKYRYYHVLRQEDGSSSWTNLGSRFAYQPDRASGYIFKFRNTGLTLGGKIYWYKIRCYDANGNYYDTKPLKLSTRWQGMAIYGSNNTGTPIYAANNSGFNMGPWR